MGKIFKGQGRSGLTGPTVQKTMGKNKNSAAKNDKMTAMGILENGRCPDGNTQMGSCCPSYSPTMVTMPMYQGRPKQ